MSTDECSICGENRASYLWRIRDNIGTEIYNEGICLFCIFEGIAQIKGVKVNKRIEKVDRDALRKKEELRQTKIANLKGKKKDDTA